MLSLHLCHYAHRRDGLFPLGAYFKRLARTDNPVPAFWAQTKPRKGQPFYIYYSFLKGKTQRSKTEVSWSNSFAWFCVSQGSLVSSGRIEGWGTLMTDRMVGPPIEASTTWGRVVSRGNMGALFPAPGRIERQKQAGARTALLLTSSRCSLKKNLQIQKSIFWEKTDL